MFRAERQFTHDQHAMNATSLRLALLAAAVSVGISAPALAQSAPKAKPGSTASKSSSAAALKPIAGTWVGTATVPMPDTSIVVPVFYTFVDGPDGVTGSAMVPGQGNGPISNVVRSGDNIRFRVTVKQTTKEGVEKTALLEHDAKLAADGAIEGMVNFENKPVAKIRIMQNKPAPKK
jgi:hypothetical protein